MKRASSSVAMRSVWNTALSVRAFPLSSASFSRRYLQAAAQTAVQPQGQENPSAIDRLKKLKVKKPRKEYPPVYFKEETEQQRVDKAKALLANYKPVIPAPRIGYNEHQVINVLEICASLHQHPEKQAIADKAVELLLQNPKSAGVIASTRAVKVLGQLKRLSDCYRVLDALKANKQVATAATIHTLIRACGQNQALDKAWEAFKNMKKPAQKRTATSVAAMVDALTRNGQWEEANKLIKNSESDYKIKLAFRPIRRYLFQCLVQKEQAKGLAMLEYAKSNQVTAKELQWLEDKLRNPSTFAPEQLAELERGDL